eukprot:5655497-Lingulodinium_polyedra.AAC.1
MDQLNPIQSSPGQSNPIRRLDWAGLDWNGPNLVLSRSNHWIGLDWTGMDWIGLDWIGLDWIGLVESSPTDFTSGHRSISQPTNQQE